MCVACVSWPLGDPTQHRGTQPSSRTCLLRSEMDRSRADRESCYRRQISVTDQDISVDLMSKAEETLKWRAGLCRLTAVSHWWPWVEQCRERKPDWFEEKKNVIVHLTTAEKNDHHGVFVAESSAGRKYNPVDLLSNNKARPHTPELHQHTTIPLLHNRRAGSHPFTSYCHD